MRLPILTCVLLLALACQSEEQQIAEHSQRAAEYYAAEQWREAKIEYLNLLQVAPQDGEANFRLAEVQRRLGEFGDALWRYREAVRLEPEKASWRARLAAMLFRSQRVDDARAEIDEALRLQPDNVEALVLQARLQVADEQPEQAIETLDQVLELTAGFAPPGDDLSEEQELERGLRHGAYRLKTQIQLALQQTEAAEVTMRQFAADYDEPTAHLLLAVFLVDTERAEEAQEAYRKAIQSSSEGDERMRAQFAMAGFLAAKADNEGAEKILLEAREDLPEREEPLVQLARLYASMGRPEDASRMLEEVAAQQPDRAAPLLALSDYERSQGNREAAFAALERALAREPGNEQARLAKAEYLMDRGPDDADEARTLVAEVLEENPDSVLGMMTQAKFDLLDGKNVEASHRLRRVVQEAPLSLAHVMLATAYQRMGQPDLARSELLAAIQLDPNNLVARRGLTQLHVEAGNYALAIQEADAALRRAPGDTPMLLLRARALTADRKPAEALEVLESIEFEKGPSSQPTRLAVALLYLQLGKSDQGAVLAEQVLQEDPANTTALRLWSTQKAQTGQADEAFARVEALIAENPDDPELYELRAALRLASGPGEGGGEALRDDILADLDRSIEKDPSRAEPWILKGNVYRIDRNWEEAVRSLERAIELDPSKVDAHVMRAETLERQGQLDRARVAYEELLAVHADHAMAKNNLAWLLADADSPSPEDLDRAQDLAQDAKEAFPDSAAIADTLGWVMLKKGIPRAAIPLFREAVGKASNSAVRATARYHLALAYEKAGEADKAIAELEIAISEDANFPDRGEAASALERLRTG